MHILVRTNTRRLQFCFMFFSSFTCCRYKTVSLVSNYRCINPTFLFFHSLTWMGLTFVHVLLTILQNELFELLVYELLNENMLTSIESFRSIEIEKWDIFLLYGLSLYYVYFTWNKMECVVKLTKYKVSQKNYIEFEI